MPIVDGETAYNWDEKLEKPQNLEKIGTKQEIFVEKILINGVMYKQVQLRNT